MALVVISDRGPLYLPRCLEALDRIDIHFDQQIIVEDPLHFYDQNEVVRHAWGQVETDFVFHLEEDFLLHELDLPKMVAILQANPDLAQLVLKRQPWNGEEVAAGGIIECFPDSYKDGDGFVRHRRFFSLNPCLIPRQVINLSWAGSEGDMTDRCVAADYWFAFYGARHDPPRCTHIGEVRACA